MSLIEVAQKLLALNPDAVELFKKANGRSEPQGGRSPSAVPCTWKGPVGGGLVNRSSRRPVLTQATADGPLAAFLSCERLAANAWCSDTAAAPQGARASTPRAAGRCLRPSQCRVLPAAMLDEDEDGRVDEAALRQLTEMGFPESRAVKALQLNQYVLPCQTQQAWSCGVPRGTQTL